MRVRTLSRLAMVLVGMFLLIGCTTEAKKGEAIKKSPEESSKKTKVVLLLNWYPEAEHGGFYAAFVHGIYAEKGLDVEIRPGGRSVSVAPEIMLGRAQFGVGNADDVLMARAQDAQLTALFAPMQNGPRCIMVREDSGIKQFDQLKNIKLQIDSGRPYIPFLKSKGLLDPSVQIVPYYGTVAELVAGPGVAQQAYNFSEPFLAEQKGVQVTNLMMSEIGYNPYASCLVSSADFISKNEGVVQKMVEASIEGWKKYLAEPNETNQYILKQNNQGMTAEALDYGAKKLKDLCSPEGLDSKDFGTMTMQRWETLLSQLVELKLIDGAKVDLKSAVELKFLPK